MAARRGTSHWPVARLRSTRYAQSVSIHSGALTFELRPITAREWELARAVRLAALADAPDAFEATLAEELQLSEERWRARARDNEVGERSRGFLVLREGVPCGMAVGVLDAAGSRASLNAMWVAENVRRRGLARALVLAVRDWARERGASSLELEVTDSSRAAHALYTSLGFVDSPQPAATCGARQSPARRMQLQWTAP